MGKEKLGRGKQESRRIGKEENWKEKKYEIGKKESMKLGKQNIEIVN